MCPSELPTAAPDRQRLSFHGGPVVRSRRISDIVLAATISIPALPARLLADWERETRERLALQPGDVESLPLPRARQRWPDYRHCVQAVTEWARAVGLQDVLATSEVALMACRGARAHHDAELYGDHAFCNLFVSEDKGLDLIFPATGRRIPLERGTVVVFDTAQIHTVADRGQQQFRSEDFPPARDGTQIFLTWELSIDTACVAHVLQTGFDGPPP